MRIAVILIILFTTGALSAHDITGKVDVLLKGDKKKQDLSNIIVYLSSPEGKIPPSALKKEFIMSTRNKQFTPGVMAVPIGASVKFPNYDPIFHNLFSVSAPNNFDLGLYKGGASKNKSFSKPGIVKVFCNVHPQMSATIVVTDSPFYTTTDKQGNFVLKNIPSGQYEIKAYSAEGQVNQKIEAKEIPVTINLSIDARNYKRLQHKNKFGKDYSSNQDDRY